MVQVLPSREKSFAKSILGGFASGAEQTGQMLPTYLSMLQNAQQQQKLKQEQVQNQAYAKSLGIDAQGLSPDILKTAIGEKLKGIRKSEEQKRDEEYFNKLFSGQRDNVPSMEEEMPQVEKEGKFRPEEISPEQIIQATTRKPAVGSVLQKLQDVERREKSEEKKEITESYKENAQFINSTYDKYEDALRKENIFDRMEQLENEGNLSYSTIINGLEQLGLKTEWLQNPANEEYNKLSLDLLGGGTLQADYGSKLFASEFRVSQQRIPTLSLTPEGRKQIIENQKVAILPAKLKEERMRYYMDKAEKEGKPIPHDLRGKILKDIRPQLEEAYDKFKQRNGRYKVREGTIPDENSIEKYYFLSDGNEDKAMKMMVEDGYVI